MKKYRKNYVYFTIIAAFSLILIKSTHLTAFPYRLYAKFLQKYVKYGRVDYKRIRKSPSLLNAIMKRISKENLRGKSKRYKLSYWSNTYNVFVISNIVSIKNNIESVKKVKGFFTKIKNKAYGGNYSLDYIEKKIIFKLTNDYRFHFILVCAAISCPILHNFPYYPSRLYRQMNYAKHFFLKSKHGIKVVGNKVYISRIFDWYKSDFGGMQGIRSIIKPYVNDLNNKKIYFQNYNWKLNIK